jgi:hypothetical protein
VKGETCEKGATWIDWIPISSRPSRESRSAILLLGWASGGQKGGLEHLPVIL